jgi:hypothetical protein
MMTVANYGKGARTAGRTQGIGAGCGGTALAPERADDRVPALKVEERSVRRIPEVLPQASGRDPQLMTGHADNRSQVSAIARGQCWASGDD